MRDKWITFLTAGLALLTLITGVMASESLLSAQAMEVPTKRITLPDFKKVDSVTSIEASEPSAVIAEHHSQTIGEVPASSEIWVHDHEKAWNLDSSVNIFRVSYPGEGGEPTVVSAYGSKVMAPGTSETYDFIIENNGSISMDYILTAEGEARFMQDGETYTIPIEARLSSYDGRYLVGSDSSWDALEALNAVHDERTVAKEHYVKYTLEWQWPFEQENIAEGDTYDTLLGNLAADGGELEATIRLNVLAQENPDSDCPGGFPKTGDSSKVAVWMTVTILSFLSLLLLLVWRGRNRKYEK